MGGQGELGDEANDRRHVGGTTVPATRERRARVIQTQWKQTDEHPQHTWTEQVASSR